MNIASHIPQSALYDISFAIVNVIEDMHLLGIVLEISN